MRLLGQRLEGDQLAGMRDRVVPVAGTLGHLGEFGERAPHALDAPLALLGEPAAELRAEAGLRVAGGLALIGAVVAEYVAGTGGVRSGLAFRILEAGYRLNIPRMFAALLLIAAAGVAIFAGLSLLSHLLLRKWHESALGPER